jgi:hypothetical protein
MYKVRCIFSDLIYFLHNGMAEIDTLLNALNSVDIWEVQQQFVAQYCHSKIFMVIFPSFLVRL